MLPFVLDKGIQNFNLVSVGFGEKNTDLLFWGIIYCILKYECLFELYDLRNTRSTIFIFPLLLKSLFGLILNGQSYTLQSKNE